MITREAFRFFSRNAGGAVGFNAQTALRLARAEDYAIAHDWIVQWEPDDTGDLGDHELWCSTARRKQAGHRDADTPHHWELECSHVVELAILRRGTDVLTSLGSIIDADRDYRRVVEAELASEALHEIEERRRKQRQARAFVRRHFAL